MVFKTFRGCSYLANLAKNIGRVAQPATITHLPIYPGLSRSRKPGRDPGRRAGRGGRDGAQPGRATFPTYYFMRTTIGASFHKASSV